MAGENPAIAGACGRIASAVKAPRIAALVVVPQVFRIVLPPLGNQIVSAVLGSAQASIIGVAELTYQPAFSFLGGESLGP